MLVILTRWHDDDLAGKLLSAAPEGGDEWTVVKYPAIAEENEGFGVTAKHFIQKDMMSKRCNVYSVR